MNHFNFDKQGHLQPKGINEMTISQFEETFVIPFDKNQRRRILFEEYMRYTNDLREVLKSSFIQWIDGSFVNNQVIEPNDIDLLTMIDHEVYKQNETVIDEKFAKFSVKKHYEKIDAYTIKSYPKNHKFHEVYREDYYYWIDWYSFTRKNRVGKRFEKGFVQLKFD